MNVFLWVVQALLAAAFLAHGLLFLFPPANLIDAMNAIMPTAFRLFLGVAEVAASLGFILPGVTRIKPMLIPCAAAGVLVITTGATVLHIVRDEFSSAVITAILFGMAAFVGYMRWKVKPILPRMVWRPPPHLRRTHHRSGASGRGHRLDPQNLT
jgi:hypothetical protein